MTQQSMIQPLPMVRPIPINPSHYTSSSISQPFQFPALFPFSSAFQLPLKLEIPSDYSLQNYSGAPGSPISEIPTNCQFSLAQPEASSSSSRCSSVESSGKIRRGRPQQEIDDAADAQSQKKKHRRLYARQYRAQMRQKVDNVKSLSDDKQLLLQEVAKLRTQVANLQQELAKSHTLLNILELSKNIQL